MEAKMKPVKNMTALKQRYPKKVHATPNIKYRPHIVAVEEGGGGCDKVSNLIDANLQANLLFIQKALQGDNVGLTEGRYYCCTGNSIWSWKSFC